jgi:hypothetical protein
MAARSISLRQLLVRPPAVLLALIAVAMPGCGGGEGARVVKAALPTVSKGLHWVGDVAPAGGALSEVARGLGTAIDTGTSVKLQLETIAASDDPFGEALVIATCYGLTDIADQYAQNSNLLPASAESWEAYLNSEVAALLPTQLSSTISTKVSQFNTAAQLASISPAAASTYVRSCALGRR